jgi:DNA transposition AAA+ family ATPase
MPQDFSTAPITSTIAPLRNVAALAELVQRVVHRTPGLPGMATFHGFSGYGKTFAAIYAANKFRAYHVQVKSVWTRKKLAQAVLAEMGIQPASTIPDMIDQIGQQLSLSGRPLIIDEADFLVAKGMIEVVRDIYESSQSAIILIGEEGLPTALRRWERVHGRMLDWVPAQAAAQSDARHLAHLYCRGIELTDDLLIALHEASGGSIRRICVSLDKVREQAETAGLTRMTRADFKGEFFTGAAPASRRA